MEAAVQTRRLGTKRVKAAPAEKSVAWRHVLLFVLLAYGIAWTYWMAVVEHPWHAITTWSNTPKDYTEGAAAALGMFAPAIAAIIMRLFFSKEGLKGSFGPVLHRWRYYAIAILGPALFVTTVINIADVNGLGEFSLGTDKPIWLVYLLLLLIGTPVSALLALGEEYGWRGYLLPKLLPLGEVKASLIIGLIWAPWHLPLLMVGLNYGGHNPLMVLGMMTALGIGMSLLFTRMFVAAGGAVLVTAFMHGSLNAFSDRLSDADHLSGNALVDSVGGLVGMGFIAVAVLVAYSLRRKTGGSFTSDPAISKSGPRPLDMPSPGKPEAVTAH
jgi:MFS family permease